MKWTFPLPTSDATSYPRWGFNIVVFATNYLASRQDVRHAATFEEHAGIVASDRQPWRCKACGEILPRPPDARKPRQWCFDCWREKQRASSRESQRKIRIKASE